MSAIAQLAIQDAAHQTRDKQLLQHAAAQASVMLQGGPNRPGYVGLGALVSSAEAALKVCACSTTAVQQHGLWSMITAVPNT